MDDFMDEYDIEQQEKEYEQDNANESLYGPTEDEQPKEKKLVAKKVVARGRGRSGSRGKKAEPITGVELKVKPDPDKIKVTVMINERIYKHLRIYTFLKGMTITDLINIAIKNYLLTDKSTIQDFKKEMDIM